MNARPWLRDFVMRWALLVLGLVAAVATVGLYGEWRALGTRPLALPLRGAVDAAAANEGHEAWVELAGVHLEDCRRGLRTRKGHLEHYLPVDDRLLVAVVLDSADACDRFATEPLAGILRLASLETGERARQRTGTTYATVWELCTNCDAATEWTGFMAVGLIACSLLFAGGFPLVGALERGGSVVRQYLGVVSLGLGVLLSVSDHGWGGAGCLAVGALLLLGRGPARR